MSCLKSCRKLKNLGVSLSMVLVVLSHVSLLAIFISLFELKEKIAIVTNNRPS